MADALGSGPSDRKVVRVQLPLPAPRQDIQALWQKLDFRCPIAWSQGPSRGLLLCGRSSL